jgi:hypothetical protein
MKSSIPALAAMQDRFGQVERELEVSEQKRKSSEMARMSQLREDLTKLEKTLAAEIKRRIESTKALQDLFADQILSVKNKLEALFNEKLVAIQTAAETLAKRTGAVERDFAVERERYLHDIQERTGGVAKDLMLMQDVISRETMVRSEKESVLARRIVEAELKVEQKIARERGGLDQKMAMLRESLIEYKRIRDRGDDKFQAFVLEEIATLKNGIVIETQSREGADDDIVQALNHYTKALQDALRIVNGQRVI